MIETMMVALVFIVVLMVGLGFFFKFQFFPYLFYHLPDGIPDLLIFKVKDLQDPGATLVFHLHFAAPLPAEQLYCYQR